MHSLFRARKGLLHILGLSLLLASCDARIPGPEPSPPQASRTPLTGDQSASALPTIPLAATAEDTPFATPTASASPTSSASPSAAPSPKPTTSPSATSTPTPAPTDIPNPTPQPNVQLETALHHQQNGDYGQAIATYLAVLAGEPPPDQARLARYHLAESYLLNRDYPDAALAWSDFLSAYPEDDLLPQALLMAGRAHDGAGDCAQAISLYNAHLTHDTLLADIVHSWIGDCHGLTGFHQEAIAAYRKALEAASDQEAQSELREKVAAAHLALSDVDAAIAEYDAILGIAHKGAYRAEIEYHAGQALAGAGRQEAAQERYRGV